MRSDRTLPHATIEVKEEQITTRLRRNEAGKSQQMRHEPETSNYILYVLYILSGSPPE